MPVLDNFELALKNAPTDDFAKGMVLIHDQLVEVLHDSGLSEIDATKMFDPNLHEAMMCKEVDGKKTNEIVEVFQKGYMLNGKVLRHSKVVVAK